MRLKPRMHEAHNNLAGAYKNMGDSSSPGQLSRSDSHQAGFCPGSLQYRRDLRRAKPIEEARIHYLEAVRWHPELAEAHNNLGSLYLKLGRADSARDSFVAGVKFKPAARRLRQQYPALRTISAGHDPGENGPHARAWAKTYAEPLRDTWPVHQRDRDPERRLRLGFVSADLGFHPVGCFFLPLLENLDREKYGNLSLRGQEEPDFQADRLARAAINGDRFTICPKPSWRR